MEYWYVFPIAIFVATICNASGFSGSVLFQPFFNFILGIPITQSVATGIATETIGMSSGAFRYWRMGNKIDFRAVKKVFPYVYAGIASGILLFVFIPKLWLRLVVGCSIFSIATYQLYLSYLGKFNVNDKADLKVLGSLSSRFKSFFAGVSSASTGTGIAEIHQPMFEHDAGLKIKKANASAILIESLGNWFITLLNIKLGNINYQIFIFSAAGVFIGGQIGPLISSYLSDRILKIIFGISVSIIGLIYIITSIFNLNIVRV
tara:strand:- start:240 stop:1025 length:786 start_codon:yes stop_codon:yes gene_type:complete